MLRVTCEFTGAAGTPYYTTDYYNGTTSGEATAAVSSSFDFWFQLQNILHTDMILTTDPEVHLVDPATGLTTATYNVPSGTIEFTGAGEHLPPANQGLLKYTTGDYVNGRQLRGRKFIPGILESSTTNGRPSAALITLISDAFTASRPEATAAGGQVVYSKTYGQASIITGHSVWSEFAVLRSRRD